MAVDGYTYYQDYKVAVLRRASRKVTGGIDRSRGHGSTIYQKWLQGKSVEEAANAVAAYYWEGH